MEVGIVGLPGIGKSTVFNVLTNASGPTPLSSASSLKPNVRMVNVPDDRLERIHQYIATDRIVPATVRVVDVAGIAKGASKGEGLGNKFLAHIREVDAILHVVRCFGGDLPHPEGSVDPMRDIENVDTELILADLETVEKNVEKQRKLARGGAKEAVAAVAVVEQLIAALGKGTPVRAIPFHKPDEIKQVKMLGLVTSKKVLYVANVGEDDLHGESAMVQKMREHAAKEGSVVVPVCGKLEAELAELTPEDRTAMLTDLGMKESASATLIREAYRLLGLQSFFTAGPMEIKAWTIPIGATAPQAAGVIHTDFEKGFIRAEVYNFADLMEYKSEAAIKAAGKMRAEGKNYIFREGDITHFLFNK